MAEVEKYPSNSYTNRMDKKPKKEIKPVVKNEVRIQKKGLGEKFSETFLQADIQSVKNSVIFDILIPAAKDMFSDMTKGLVDGLLYGERRGSRTYRDRGSSRVYRRYDDCYDDRPRRRQREDDDPPFASSRSIVDNLIFKTRGEAEEVLSNAIDYIEEYDSISVKDLYAYANKKSDFTKEKYGWYDLSSASVERIREGYLLKLPKPVVID